MTTTSDLGDGVAPPPSSASPAGRPLPAEASRPSSTNGGRPTACSWPYGVMSRRG